MGRGFGGIHIWRCARVAMLTFVGNSFPECAGALAAAAGAAVPRGVVIIVRGLHPLHSNRNSNKIEASFILNMNPRPRTRSLRWTSQPAYAPKSHRSISLALLPHSSPVSQPPARRLRHSPRSSPQPKRASWRATSPPATSSMPHSCLLSRPRFSTPPMSRR